MGQTSAEISADQFDNVSSFDNGRHVWLYARTYVKSHRFVKINFGVYSKSMGLFLKKSQLRFTAVAEGRGRGVAPY